jgi:hypothetical protein
MVVVLFVLPLCRPGHIDVVSAQPLGKVSAGSAPQGRGVGADSLMPSLATGRTIECR